MPSINICANQHPKVVVLIPSIQNPTTAIMPAATREQLAVIARKHGVWIIEDNIYGACVDDAPAPIAALAPDITFHLGGLSKSVCSGHPVSLGIMVRLPMSDRCRLRTRC